MYFCEAKLNFQHHYFSPQCHVIFRNHYNMLIYIINSGKVVLLNIFLALLPAILFLGIFDENVYLK